ncbi:hypothetical protein [Leptolyngbya sp. 7M]|uniref:hypothetical protein n=1 Tax=Leptolyngbya sp. 7M TaxID=2812896 RepID=UPI001B8C1B6B|nr:hypothetical protein [Leptolyngbya sp. 7M]QYO67634.1 hypothetical protein JVX88_13065 [Leptolyngbya sp. 7M]
MQPALRITTKVLPGNRIEIQIPEGEIGEDVEVIVLLPEKPQISKQNVLAFFEEVHRQGPFRTPEEIDRDLQREKEAWDS